MSLIVDGSGYCSVHKSYHCDCWRPSKKDQFEKEQEQRRKDFRPHDFLGKELGATETVGAEGQYHPHPGRLKMERDLGPAGRLEFCWAREGIAEVAVAEGYAPLAEVLVEALFQAQFGKGKKCHANGKPFMEQPIITGGRECGPGGLAFQARKKILEALNCQDDDRAIEDLLGAIVYTAAMVLLRREKNDGSR